MASSKIISRNYVPMLPLSYSIASNSNLKTFPGILTDSGRKIIITIDIPWNITDWWATYSGTAKVTRLIGSLRGVNGYLRSDLANTDLLSVAYLTWSVGSASSAMILQGVVTNTITGVTNNTPVMFTGTFTIAPN